MASEQQFAELLAELKQLNERLQKVEEKSVATPPKVGRPVTNREKSKGVFELNIDSFISNVEIEGFRITFNPGRAFLSIVSGLTQALVLKLKIESRFPETLKRFSDGWQRVKSEFAVEFNKARPEAKKQEPGDST
jgi:hypothetical protein